MSLNKLWLRLTLLFVAAIPILAQQTTATLVGTVTDPSNSAVSGGAVTVVNLKTGVRRESKTDSTGNYTIPFLPEGDYSVTATMAGFRQKLVAGVNPTRGQTRPVAF